MGWDGMGWDGMGWDGMGWDAMRCDAMRDGMGCVPAGSRSMRQQAAGSRQQERELCSAYSQHAMAIRSEGKPGSASPPPYPFTLLTACNGDQIGGQAWQYPSWLLEASTKHRAAHRVGPSQLQAVVVPP